MNKILIVASFALLASCSAEKDSAVEAQASGAATGAASAAAAPAVAATPGAYDFTAPDGTQGTTTIAADGTYVDTDTAGKVTAKGTWTSKDGKTCFIAEGKSEECYADSAPAADGSFTATAADGSVTKVKPQAK